MSDRWPAIGAAHRHDSALRVPFVIDGVVIGSVARAHLAALKAHADVVAISGDAVTLLAPPATRDADLARLNRWLHAQGLVIGWRDEPYVVVLHPADKPLAHIERAASRFWGTLTFAAHANGHVVDGQGRPTHLWVARRSLAKQTDPGMLDNLIGGGVPAGQTPAQTLVREGWEEAGLSPSQMAAATPGRVIRLLRDIPEGLQHEWLYVFDLPLPADVQPVNQDGEVASLQLLPIHDAIALASSAEMTVDASLVVLDFALRHGLFGEPHPDLVACSQPLWADTALTR